MQVHFYNKCMRMLYDSVTTEHRSYNRLTENSNLVSAKIYNVKDH